MKKLTSKLKKYWEVDHVEQARNGLWYAIFENGEYDCYFGGFKTKDALIDEMYRKMEEDEQESEVEYSEVIDDKSLSEEEISRIYGEEVYTYENE